jgi:hypothetical protein
MSSLYEKLKAEADARSKERRKRLGHVVANMASDGGAQYMIRALCERIEALEARTEPCECWSSHVCERCQKLEALGE